MPKKEFTNFKDLLNGVEEELANSLDKEVAEKIKQKISERARKNVILQTPGRAVGGIDDVSQMKDRVDRKKRSMTLTVTDVAKPSPSVFGTKFDTSKDSAVGGTMFANWEWGNGLGNQMIALGEICMTLIWQGLKEDMVQ